MNYDLEKRTLEFSKSVIVLVRPIKQNELNRNIISQLIRSATSVGANYREANGASSKKDFANKIHICRKEIQETEYWLELLSEACSEIIEKVRVIWKEAHQLTLIFNKISSSIKSKIEN
jgi:four helix bundle protein